MHLMFNRDSFLIAPILVLFMSHGLLYYVFPEQHYATGSSGWISYIKYLCVFIALPALIHRKFNRHIEIWIVIGISVIVLPFCLHLHWGNDSNFLLIQFQMASLGYFFGPFIVRYFSEIKRKEYYLLIILIITIITTLSEILLGSFLDVYSRSGLRGIGPFINPNNTGIVVAIFAVIYHQQCKKTGFNIIIALLCIITLAATGSKTAMAMYIIGIILSIKISWKIFILLTVPILLIVNSENIRQVWSFLKLREFSFESGETRSFGIENLLHTYSNGSFLEILFGFSNQSQVDNTYLDILTYGGWFLLSLFLVLQAASVIICIQRRLSLLLVLHVLFFLAMLSTNITRLWPTGYIYWVLISITMIKPQRYNGYLLKN
jgi:hypothetical protein